MTTKAKADAAIDYTAMEYWPLIDAAKAEFKLIQQASKNGEPIPATPARDEVTRRNADMTSTTKTKSKKAGGGDRIKGRTDIRFFHDGMSMSEGHKHKLSTVAYFHSFDLDGDKPRVGTKEFAAVLAKLGVKDPTEPGWMVKLPNGVTIECRKENEKSQFKGERVTRSKMSAKKAAPKSNVTPITKKAAGATKGTTKPTPPKGTAPKKAHNPPKKAVADRGKVTRSRQVTPIPKAKQATKARKSA